MDHIIDPFPIVQCKDEAVHGEYRTKRVIMEICNEVQRAMEAGEPYQTRLDPPQVDPPVALPPRVPTEGK